MEGQSDPRIDRLFEYTRWHIGIYLAAGGGLAALIGTDEAPWILPCVVSSPASVALLCVALLLVTLAGLCGGVIASTLTCTTRFEDFWDAPAGPTVAHRWWLGRKLLWHEGKHWATAEHVLFWLALIAFLAALAVGVLGGSGCEPGEPREKPGSETACARRS